MSKALIPAGTSGSVLGLYAGPVAPLGSDGQRSAFVKHPVAGSRALTGEGLEGDQHADLRVHGGREKALHLYPAEHYGRLAAAWPELGEMLIPGSLGENVSTRGWTEENVCVGDVFRVGDAQVQVSQPRSPCWKIDARFAHEGLTRHIAEHGLTGWYFRVLRPGTVEVGAPFELVERNAAAITLARLWRASRAHRPAQRELEAVRAAPGLAPDWVRRLAERIEWLRRNTQP